MAAAPQAAPAPGPPPPGRRTSARGESSSWPLVDRLCLWLCWGAGVTLCLVAGSIVAYMAYKGIQYVRPELIFERPADEPDQSRSGGFWDPIVGTFILVTIGTLIAAPVGIAIAVWLSEYRRPAWLARAVESGVEIVAGTPSIVLAIFGLLLFSNAIFEIMSFKSETGTVFGRSFLVAGTMMSLIALPLIVGATRESLQAIPNHVREASYALGKTKWATVRRVLVPAARPGIATGAALGMGRIAGDTAIVVILLGGTQRLLEQDSFPIIGDLRGQGSSLTNYVYQNSPAGEGNAADKAYAAAFVLLALVIALNYVVDRIARREVAWTR
jgi:phosphate transport system permease protein